jgi:hypothetical protein
MDFLKLRGENWYTGSRDVTWDTKRGLSHDITRGQVSYYTKPVAKSK